MKNLDYLLALVLVVAWTPFTAAAQYSNDAWDESFGSGGLQVITEFITTAAGGPRASAMDPDGNIYIAGGNWNTLDGVTNTAEYSFAKWTRSSGTWEPMFEGVSSFDVKIMVVAPDGTLYIGGTWSSFFDGTDTIETQGVVKWDGSSWSEVGGGLRSDFGAPFVESMAVDNDGNLYVGGTFHHAGGVSALGVAKWDGSSWSALGEGFESGVSTLAVSPDGTLYAGVNPGGFVDEFNRIAKWNGSAWEGLSWGFNEGQVLAIAFDENGNVYAGGSMSTAGSSRIKFFFINGIAIFDGTRWSALDNGLNGYVRTLAFANGQLIAGGDFTATDDEQTSVSGMAVWDGSAWHSLGEGITSSEEFTFSKNVSHMHVSETPGDSANKDLVVVGRFDRAGGFVANNVALWNIGAGGGGGSGLIPGEWNETSDIGWVYAYTESIGFGVNYGYLYIADAPWYFFYNGMGWLYHASTIDSTLYWYSPDLGWLIQSFSSPWFTYHNGSEWVWDNFLDPSL